MSLVEQLKQDMITAMKEKDKERLTVIRMVKAALDKERIDSKKDFNIFPLMATLSKCLWQVEEIDHIINTDYCKDDKSDNKFIDCCIDGNVKYLITQDKHINSAGDKIKKEHDIEVLSPMQFYYKYSRHQL